VNFRLRGVLPLSALTALALAGCAVVGSAPTFDEGGKVSLGCRSTLGSYSLPKTVINLVITKLKTEPFHVLQAITPTQVTDNQHTFCLDHLRSPTASDEVRVFKNKISVVEATDDPVNSPAGIALRQRPKITAVNQKSTPFLQLVASKAVDHTAGIIRRLVRAAFILLTNSGGFSSARSSVGRPFKDNAANPIVVADFTVDPFDHYDMARVNDAVRGYGFCFVLEDYTFNTSRLTADQYCRAPRKGVEGGAPLAAAAIRDLHYLVPKPKDGIFYRPRASYRLSVYINDDPGGRGNAWRLGSIQNLKAENIMPIVSVGVDRAVFATRRTGLVFTDGALTNVCISKGSEVESAIQIPLDVIYGLVALPSETLRAALDDADTSRQLLEAQKRLITAQNNYIKFLADPNATALPAGTPTAGSAKGALSLGTSPVTNDEGSYYKNDAPPDAGPIFAAGGDALSEICAELAVTSTLNPAVAGTPTAGAF
jgi:hypothetical protein